MSAQWEEFLRVNLTTIVQNAVDVAKEQILDLSEHGLSVSPI